MNDPLVDTLTDALDIYGRPDDGLPVHLAAVLRREHTIDPPFTSGGQLQSAALHAFVTNSGNL